MADDHGLSREFVRWLTPQDHAVSIRASHFPGAHASRF
jgi:hypothetical protein